MYIFIKEYMYTFMSISQSYVLCMFDNLAVYNHIGITNGQILFH